MTNRAQVFAVVRFDLFLIGHAAPESCATVKGLVSTAEEAQREVERLNALVDDDGVLYAWQPTRWLGREHSGDDVQLESGPDPDDSVP
jgi:hypothetical protein